ncbi:uncharacterized protein LOC116138206 [Pistacia vera]|uniref:uncharacterized protein LOC116138206 n=1 Tax=Pistacia vera TaxID=55513 RepID=UPI0012632746|nr:uncharacterized protein LOC116138206 [Pistacia vera]
MHGIVKGYTRWLYHGEFIAKKKHVPNDLKTKEKDDIIGMIHDAAGPNLMDAIMQDVCVQDTIEPNNPNNVEPDASPLVPNKEALKFLKLLEDAQQQLYPGCDEFSKLSFIVELFQIKCLYGISDKAVDCIMQLLKKALPRGENLPKSFCDARKLIRDLGLHYEKIDACENDCVLFWKDNANDENCLICGESRWKSVEKNAINPNKSGKKIPRKVLRYFPLKQRLQRLFMSSKTASDMRWHHEERPQDGILRHPADSDAWKSFDILHPGFSREPRNVRLGLASDGINPFGNMSVSYSTWPVIVNVYNLPPWICMKQPYCLLSLLIPGPKAPGNDIDVYLQPLIQELQELWHYGVETFDASKKENFCMRAALLWTINDFPTYANLSG